MNVAEFGWLTDHTTFSALRPPPSPPFATKPQKALLCFPPGDNFSTFFKQVVKSSTTVSLIWRDDDVCPGSPGSNSWRNRSVKSTVIMICISYPCWGWCPGFYLQRHKRNCEWNIDKGTQGCKEQGYFHVGEVAGDLGKSGEEHWYLQDGTYQLYRGVASDMWYPTYEKPSEDTDRQRQKPSHDS
jgi:hypothetical protein